MATLSALYWKFIIARTFVGRPISVVVLFIATMYAVFQVTLAVNAHGVIEQCILVGLTICAAHITAGFFFFRDGLMLSVGSWPRVLEIHAGKSFFRARKKSEALAALHAVIRDARSGGILTVTMETPLFATKAVLDRYARSIATIAGDHVLSYHTSIELAPWYSALLFMIPRHAVMRRICDIQERNTRLIWHGRRLVCGRLELRLRPSA